jgi:cellulose-binding protein
LNLIANGLRGYEDNSPGGWAGRGASEAALSTGQNPLPQITISSYDDLLELQEQAAARPRPPSPDPNFTPAAQNDFAARLRWSVTPKYADANHAPHVAIRGKEMIAWPGQTIRVNGSASDPDKDAVTVRWWQWKEAGSYPGEVTIATPTKLSTLVQVPADAAEGQTIHLILEVTDDGTPALTRYQRLVVTIRR